MSSPEAGSRLAEGLTVHQIHRHARRTLLAVLVLTALVAANCVLLGPGRIVSHWMELLLLGATLVWAIVTAAYAARGYMLARRYGRERGVELSGMVDLLTGLPNRMGLIAALEGYDLALRDLDRRVRIIDIDLMNLDKVNYEFGQTVGDAVLCDLAGILQENVPERDLVGRLGGDEFLVVLPNAEIAEAQELAQQLGAAISEYRLDLGERGEVHGLKANVSVASYLPERASLHETVVSAKEATAHGQLPEAVPGEEGFYHLPRITLGAFAVHRWESLPKERRDQFKLWQREPNDALKAAMVNDIARMLDEKAESHWVDFVTAVPAPGGRVAPCRDLAEAVAERLGLPYRDTMRADTSGPETRTIEPVVDAVLERGKGVLLISDVVSSGILERRCIRRLSAGGVHVQLAAWAGY